MNRKEEKRKEESSFFSSYPLDIYLQVLPLRGKYDFTAAQTASLERWQKTSFQLQGVWQQGAKAGLADVD